MDKRGMSEIVSTVLIILFTVAGAALLASIITPYVKNKLSSSSECREYNTGYLEFEDNMQGINYNCYREIDSATRDYGFSIKSSESEKSLYEKVAGFNVVLTGKESSVTVSVITGGTDPSIKELGGSGGVYSLPDVGETLTYIYRGSSALQPDNENFRSDIYVVLKSGKVCGLSDSIPVRPCLPGAY